MLELDERRKYPPNLSVIFQKNDLQKWKENSISYGNRWIVETEFSRIKECL